MPAKERSGEHTDRGNSGSVGHHDAHLLGVRSLVANKLYDADGNFVGKLEEIVLDVRTGCVRHVIVAMGGVLGLGRRRFAVPWSALQPDAQYCRAVVDVAQMRLTAVPVPNDDPWLRRPAARQLTGVGLPRITRALGAGD
jgi:sporulation protein YlmC with PRC-barrel domain